MLFYDIVSGFTDTKETILYCVCLYGPDEDVTVVPTTPLVFSTYEAMSNFLISPAGKKDLAEWKQNGLKVFTRAIKTLTPKN